MTYAMFLGSFKLLLLMPAVNTDPSRSKGQLKPLLTLRCSEAPLQAVYVQYSPDGKLLATSGRNHSVILWDAATGKRRRTLEAEGDGEGSLSSFSFSPDGKRLVAPGRKALRAWDTGSGRLLFAVSHARTHVGEAAFSPTGQHLASADFGPSPELGLKVRIRSAQTGAPVATLPAALGLSLAFTADGRRLAAGGANGEVPVLEVASGSADRTVKVWATDKGPEALTLKGHTERVNAVAWSRDGQRLASASADRTARIWGVGNAQQEVEIAVEVEGRLTREGPRDGQRKKPYKVHTVRTTFDPKESGAYTLTVEKSVSK